MKLVSRYARQAPRPPSRFLKVTTVGLMAVTMALAASGLISRAGAAQSPTWRTLALSSGHRVPASWGQPRPVQLASGKRATSDGSSSPFVSPNWSGYVDTGKSAQFSSATAMWSVPKTTGTTGDSSTWVGIDGFADNDLIQAGTDQSDGTYYAWYELIPQVAFELGAVQAGDQMYVDIYQGVPGTWQITIEDLTQKVTWAGPVAYNAAEESAEWVEEAPTLVSSGTIETLADYGSVTFTHMGVGGTGTAGATAQPIYLQDTASARVVSYPSPYDPVTDSLHITYGRPPGGMVGYPPTPIAAPPTTTTTSPPPSAPATTTTVPGGALSPTTTTAAGNASSPTTTTGAAAPNGHGYWLVDSGGTVFAFGDASLYGQGQVGPAPIVGMAATVDDKGYWLVSDIGGVFAFGDARYAGSVPGLSPKMGGQVVRARSVVGVAASPTGGYWVVTGDGSVFAFGGAHFAGACTQRPAPCQGPVSALVPDASGRGYWLLLRNGRMVAFGDARPVTDSDCLTTDPPGAVAGAATHEGKGYWVVLANGTTCAEGDALTTTIWEAYRITNNKHPVVALVTDQARAGAWLVLADGLVDRYGDAPKLGDFSGKKPPLPIVGAAGF